MSTSSPFDELTEEADPVPRRPARRPWWRWNLITLAVALFALIWLRELIGFDSGLVWLLAFSVFFVWGFGPAFFVPNWITTMAAAYSDAQQGPLLQPWAGNLPLVVLKITAIVFGLLSLVHMTVAAYALASPGSGKFFGTQGNLIFWLMQAAWVIALPVIEFLLSAGLFVLTEIALRLGKR